MASNYIYILPVILILLHPFCCVIKADEDDVTNEAATPASNEIARNPVTNEVPTNLVTTAETVNRNHSEGNAAMAGSVTDGSGDNANTTTGNNGGSGDNTKLDGNSVGASQDNTTTVDKSGEGNLTETADATPGSENTVMTGRSMTGSGDTIKTADNKVAADGDNATTLGNSAGSDGNNTTMADKDVAAPPGGNSTVEPGGDNATVSGGALSADAETIPARTIPAGYSEDNSTMMGRSISAGGGDNNMSAIAIGDSNITIGDSSAAANGSNLTSGDSIQLPPQSPSDTSPAAISDVTTVNNQKSGNNGTADENRAMKPAQHNARADEGIGYGKLCKLSENCKDFPSVKCVTNSLRVATCRCTFLSTLSEGLASDPMARHQCTLNVFSPCSNAPGEPDSPCTKNADCIKDTLGMSNTKYCRCRKGFKTAENEDKFPAFCVPDDSKEEAASDYEFGAGPRQIELPKYYKLSITAVAAGLLLLVG